MYSNTAQAFYTKSVHQETQQLPLRNRGFSHLDNISHQPSHHQSYNAHLSEDKVSEIKKKYDKSYTPNHNKSVKDSNPPSNPSLSFGKNTLRYEGHDENSTWSLYKEPTQNQRCFNDQIAGNASQYSMQKMSYGRPSAKSQLQNGLSALNSMKNELKSKLSDLASKNQAHPSQYIRDHQQKEMRQSNLDTSYDMIVSKYSRSNGLSENEGLQTNFSKYRPEYEKPSSFPYNYSFANKSTIFERQSSKIDSLPMNQPKSNQYNFSKHNGRQRQSQDPYKKNIQKSSESFMLQERNERRQIQDGKLPDQKTTLSYINNGQKERVREQQRSTFEFTLRKNQEVANKSFLKPNDTHTYTHKPEASKYEPRADNYSKYEVKNPKTNNVNRDQQSNKIAHSPYKGESRDSEVISREIQKLDLKIKQIQQNKKALNISFNPYSISKSSNKISAEPRQNQRKQLSKYQRHENTTKSPLFSNPPNASVDFDRKKPILEARHQDKAKANPTVNQSMPFQSIRNGQRPLSIPFTPAESQNDDDQQISERSNADMSFESKKHNYTKKNEADYGIQDRKKQMQSKLQASNSIKALVKAFGEQVALDEAFRNNKIWFASENNERKWVMLKKELQNIGVNKSEAMLKDTFSLEQSQNNPFFSVSDSKCNLQSLAQSYLQGQSHWDQKISRKFRKADLEKEGLNSQKIDYDRKGFIEVEDLVRFLNLQSGTFFRLRDVSIIFKRISKGTQMQFSDLIDAVSA